MALSSSASFAGSGVFSVLGGFSTLVGVSWADFSIFSFFASFLFDFLPLAFDDVGLSGAGGAVSSAKCTECDEDGRDKAGLWVLISLATDSS